LIEFHPWWVQWPDRLQHEQEAFARRGWTFDLDTDELARGRIVLVGVAPIAEGETAKLIVIYPDTFPHTRMAIYAPDLKLARHQNPLGSNLCALPASSAYWRPSMLAARVIEEQLPEIVRLARADNPSESELEYPQGEPVSVYYPYLPTGGILIPEELFDLPDGSTSGTMEIIFDPDDMWLTESFEDLNVSLLGRGAVVDASGVEGTKIADREDVARTFTGAVRSARWVRLSEAPLTSTFPELMELLVRDHPGLSTREWFTTDGSAGEFELVGVAFPEEVQQDRWETGWFFLILRKESDRECRGHWVRALRYSAGHLGERIPDLVGMRSATVGLAGLGTLGAPIAFQLASSLVKEIRLLDSDFCDPATSVRWPAGVRAAGSHKTLYLRHELESQFPLTHVDGFDVHVGFARLELERSEGEMLTAFLDGCDLLIDATAEDNVTRALAHLAHPAGIPQIYVWSVDGYGGVVAFLQQGVTGCFLCLERALSSGEIEPPIPASNPSMVQPKGCASPTFTAPLIDLLPLSVEATRMATSRLSGGQGGYPSLDYDVLVFQVRQGDGTSSGPVTWAPFKLAPTKGCALCDAS
jgi:ThiF family